MLSISLFLKMFAGKLFPISCFMVKKGAEDETPFMKNGRLVLEELIASSNGKCNPIQSYSAKELEKATNNYDRQQLMIEDADYILYKGLLQDGRPVTIKRYEDRGRSMGLIGSSTTDIVIGSQMSVHKNVVKLIGCCLETVHPILVYEFAGNKMLSEYLLQNQILSWKCRTKIALDIANAIAYLHNGLSRPIVHRDIRPGTVILDQDFGAKLIDFSLSIAIPDGESHVFDAVRGRTGYGPPEYVRSGYLTEKADVHSFGMFLLQLLTGENIFDHKRELVVLLDHVKDYMENERLLEVVDPTILTEGIKQQELLDFATIALQCTSDEAEMRPTMIDVAKELKHIHQLAISC